jgi:hypothetical protein
MGPAAAHPARRRGAGRLPHEWAEFWENHYGCGTPSGAFIRGFMKGATEIHDEIADQL